MKFDSYTDKAQLGGVNFFCHLLLHFQLASLTTCYWKSSVDLRIISQLDNLNLYDNITLLPKVVASKDFLSAYASSTTVQLGSALTIVPAVYISSPTSIQACSDFSLDLTSSVGFGGRAWVTVEIQVKAMPTEFEGNSTSCDLWPIERNLWPTNVSEINTFYRKDYIFIESSSLPAAYLMSKHISTKNYTI